MEKKLEATIDSAQPVEPPISATTVQQQRDVLSMIRAEGEFCGGPKAFAERYSMAPTTVRKVLDGVSNPGVKFAAAFGMQVMFGEDE